MEVLAQEVMAAREGYSLLSTLELTPRQIIGKILQPMPAIIAESAKTGPFIKHLLVVKHPVSPHFSIREVVGLMRAGFSCFIFLSLTDPMLDTRLPAATTGCLCILLPR